MICFFVCTIQARSEAINRLNVGWGGGSVPPKSFVLFLFMLRSAITSPAQEINLRVQAWLKEQAPKDKLMKLPWEAAIKDRTALKTGTSIEDGVLADAGKARELVAHLTKNATADCWASHLELHHEKAARS